MTNIFAALRAVFSKHNKDHLGNSVVKPAAGGFFLDSPFLKCSFLMDFEHFEMILRLGKLLAIREGREYVGREWEWISWEGREFPPFPPFKGGNRKLWLRRLLEKWDSSRIQS